MSDLKSERIFTSHLKLPQLRQAIPTSPAQIEDSWATQIIGLLSHWVGMVSNAAVDKGSKSPINVLHYSHEIKQWGRNNVTGVCFQIGIP